MEHYYSAREARQQLGINVGAFYYLIDTGKIKKLTPPGKNKARGQVGKRVAFELSPFTSDTRMAKVYRAVLKRHNTC